MREIVTLFSKWAQKRQSVKLVDLLIIDSPSCKVTSSQAVGWQHLYPTVPNLNPGNTLCRCQSITVYYITKQYYCIQLLLILPLRSRVTLVRELTGLDQLEAKLTVTLNHCICILKIYQSGRNSPHNLFFLLIILLYYILD